MNKRLLPVLLGITILSGCICFTSQEETLQAYAKTNRTDQRLTAALMDPLLISPAPVLPSREVTAVAGCSSIELQNLLNENRFGNYQLTVRIPAGEYRLLQELRIFSNTTLIADTNAKFIRNYEKGAMLANDLSNDSGGYTTTSNITIEGGIWDSSYINTKEDGSESFRIIHANNVTIKNVVIQNVPEGSHLITLAGVRDALVEDCSLHGYHNGTREKEALHLDIVHNETLVPSLQVKSLKYDDLPCENITIRGCNIYDFPRAIGSHSSIAGVFHKNILIEKNALHDIAEAAIRAYNYTNLTIKDNHMTNVGLGVLFYTEIENEDLHYYDALPTTKKTALPDNYQIVIENNIIENVKEVGQGKQARWGDGIRILGSSRRPAFGVTMTGNTITSVARYAIFTEAAPNLLLKENKITTTGKDGILLDGCDSSVIELNTITKTGKTGSTNCGIALLSTKDTTITKNTVTNAAKNGIFLHTKCSDAIISGNKISKTTDNGITVQVNSDNTLITDNTLSDTGKRGIFIYSDCNQTTISKNTITKTAENAIAVHNNSNGTTISENSLSKFGKRGVFLYEVTSATVTANRINGASTKADSDGIHIVKKGTSSQSFKVTKNVISNIKRNAVYLSDAKGCYVGYNTIKAAIKHGIFMQNCPNSKITGNTITCAAKGKSTGYAILTVASDKTSFTKNKSIGYAKTKAFLASASKSNTMKGNVIQ